MATNNEQQYDEQLRVLKEQFPQMNADKLIRFLRRQNGDVDKVRARLAKREHRSNKWNSVEERFGPAITALQQENPSFEGFKRIRLLKMTERYGGDIDQVRSFLQKALERHHRDRDHSHTSRRQRREELKTKYATQLAELAKTGVNVDCPCTFRLLEKTQGDVNKVMEITARRAEKKQKFSTLDEKYTNQITQLQADGVKIKNKRVLARLLEKADGQVDVAKQLINEREEKHRKRREYQHKHRSKSPATTTKHEGDETGHNRKRRRNLSSDDLENLRQLRSAGIHGNPMKILDTFHECNDSIPVTMARIEEEREQHARRRNEQFVKRSLLNEAENAYLTLNNREDWPRDIENVYLDGNNMMFVVSSLRRLCLNRAGNKTERAIGEVAAAWNQQMHIPNLELIYDSTRQLMQIDTVKISSAQPKYKTTDDMLLDIVRRPENRERNKRTVVITSDRALAALLQREGCLLLKPYSWFAHCVMVLTPDLINYEEITGTMTTASSSTAVKVRYNFDELVHRIANIDI